MNCIELRVCVTYCPDRNLTTLNHLVRLPNGTHFLHEFDGMQSPVLTLCRNDTAPLEIHGGHAHRWTGGQVDGNFRSGTIDLGCLHSIDIQYKLFQSKQFW